MAEQPSQELAQSSSNASELQPSAETEWGGARNSNRFYSLCGVALLIVAAILTAAHWRLYPVFVDSYYHMEVIHGFQQAGGIVTHAFWEMAPGGRVHIYPPGFHAAGYLAAILGVAPSTFITLISWACYPACLLTTWLWLRRIAGPRSALYALVLLCGPTAFLFNQAAHTANAAVLVIVPLALWALAAEKFRICGALNFLAITMHPIGLLLPPALVINTLLSRKNILAGFLSAAVPVFLFGPWLAHMWAARAVLPAQFTSGSWSLGGHGVNLGLLLVGSAVLGVFWTLVRRDSALAILGALLGFTVVFPLGLAGRFLMFNIHWPLACLGGLGLGELAERLERHAALRPIVQVFSLCVAYAALTVFPTLLMLPGPRGLPGPGSPGARAMGPPGPRGTRQPERQRFGPPEPQRGEEGKPRSQPHSLWHVDIQSAVLPTLLDPEARIAPGPAGRPSEMDMIHQGGAEEFLQAVSSNVARGDVIFLRNPPGAALITGVTGRWTSDGILPGVKSAQSPAEPEDCDYAARLKSNRQGRPQQGGPRGPSPPNGPPGPSGRDRPSLLERFLPPLLDDRPPGFEKVFENEFGSLWRNPVKPQHNREPVQPVVGLWLLLGIAASGLTLVTLDLLPASLLKGRKLLTAAAIVVVAACLLPLAGVALHEFRSPSVGPSEPTTGSHPHWPAPAGRSISTRTTSFHEFAERGAPQDAKMAAAPRRDRFRAGRE